VTALSPDLARTLDPCAFAAAGGMDPNPWQADLGIRSECAEDRQGDDLACSVRERLRDRNLRYRPSPDE